jgi:negative regulator of sigma E activity
MSHESLSSFLDGECPEAEIDRLLEELERDPSAGARFSRMWMTRSALEGVTVRRGQPCICAGVMAALDAEDSEQAADLHPKVVEISKWRKRVARVQWKPLAGFAAAASMGAAAVLLLVPDAQTPGTAPAVAVNDNAGRYVSAPGFVQVANQASLQTVSSRSEDVRNWPDANSADAQQLREYLFDHSNSAAAQGVGGTLRYARFAAYNADYRPDNSGGNR